MMAEPLDHIGRRDYTGVVFVGPARTGKTLGLVLGGMSYAVIVAPGDVLITQMTQHSARKFSRTDLDRAIRSSPTLAVELSPRPRDDNTYDKWFRNGIVVKIGWPSISQLSAETLRYAFLTDYDRPENHDDVDGEGPMWDLAAKRTETYMSRGKVVAESSPGEDYVVPKWLPSTPHEAPPAAGILSLYNRGTRARWYWRCQSCGEPFEARPGIDALAVPKWTDIVDVARSADLSALAEEYGRVPCSHCGVLHEGETVNAAMKVSGTRRRSNIASYWLGGVAAAYQRWDSIVLQYLQAVRTYVEIGDESQLRFVTNTATGAPYQPRAVAAKRTAEMFMERLEEWEYQSVPDEVEFLTAAVDVQAARFVVEVWGWGAGLERWLIDRFDITLSARKDRDGRALGVEPAAYSEDWDLITKQVVSRVYQDLRVVVTFCDSGGSEGVTTNAYNYHRRLQREGMGKRLYLVKGVGTLSAPRTKLTWPEDTKRRDRRGGGRGDVPVYLLNVNVLKDTVSGDLDRRTVGPGYTHLPRWVQDQAPGYFDELTAETRSAKGWETPTNARNEAFDLLVYNRAACIILKAEAINWDKPPKWLEQFWASAEAPKETLRTPPPRPQGRGRRPHRNFATDWRD